MFSCCGTVAKVSSLGATLVFPTPLFCPAPSFQSVQLKARKREAAAAEAEKRAAVKLSRAMDNAPAQPSAPSAQPSAAFAPSSSSSSSSTTSLSSSAFSAGEFSDDDLDVSSYTSSFGAPKSRWAQPPSPTKVASSQPVSSSSSSLSPARPGGAPQVTRKQPQPPNVARCVQQAQCRSHLACRSALHAP